jgi:hypothetical protein
MQGDGSVSPYEKAALRPYMRDYDGAKALAFLAEDNERRAARTEKLRTRVWERRQQRFEFDEAS